VFTHTVPARTARPTRSARERERVYTMADNPYAVELASATASCSSRNVWNVRTGPNTSRCTISASFDRGSISVGS
jgi:hypothetical protein